LKTLLTLLYSPNVKRVIILGSGAAVLHIDTKPLLLNENDWNEQCLKELERAEGNASVGLVYMATKTLAEKGTQKSTMYSL
jgi:hypothetical protein